MSKLQKIKGKYVTKETKMRIAEAFVSIITYGSKREEDRKETR